jgi:hypothetical protein
MDKFMANLFQTFWIICAISFLFGIIEMICSQAFVKFFFDIGIPIVKRQMHLPNIIGQKQTNCVFKYTEGKFKFISNNECLFLSKLHIFNLFRFTTPFPIRSKAKWKLSNVEIIGRIPLGATVFISSFLFIWTVFTIGSVDSGLFTTLFIPWVILILIIGVSYVIEKSRFETMVRELKELVSKNQQNI